MTARARPLKILLVEDDPVTADVVVKGLSQDPSLDVVHVVDGGTALTLLEQQPISAVILDVRLPVLDGHYVLLTIRENPKHAALPIILLTALGDEADVIRGFELGADDYVVKPFSTAELRLRLLRLLGRRPSRPSRRMVERPDAPRQDPAPPDFRKPTAKDPEIPPVDFEV